MEQKKLYLAGLLGMSLILGAGMITLSYISDSSNTDGSTGENLDSGSSEVKRTSGGTKYTIHPDELVQGCPGMDCIPSIDNPGFETGEVNWLEDSERVIGVEINGDARAYPLKILSKHEIVNDNVGGEPVAVTYCPLCRSGVTYSREVENETLEFGVSGKLIDANLVMYDRSTESYWNQISGKAIVGPRVPQELELKFSSITTWGKWKEGHPDTKVLSRNTGIYSASTYERDSYAGYEDSERVGFGVEDVDDRLPSKELVYGINFDNNSKAYTAEDLETESLIRDRIGEETVLIFKNPDDGTVVALVKEDDGFNFTLEEERIVDSQGNSWNFEGEQINGTGEMQKINPQGFYWFAWSKFNPETEVYNS